MSKLRVTYFLRNIICHIKLTLINLIEVLGNILLLQKVRIIKEKYGRLLDKLRNTIDKLHGSLSLDIFRSHM